MMVQNHLKTRIKSIYWNVQISAFTVRVYRNRLLQGFAKPIAQIKKFKICLLFVGKLVHNSTIDCVSPPEWKSRAGRLNQINFTFFFFTPQVFQSPLLLTNQRVY